MKMMGDEVPTNPRLQADARNSSPVLCWLGKGEIISSK